MTINLRADAPSQVEQTNPEKLTDEIKKLQDVQQEIQNYKDRIKDLEDNESYLSEVVIPDMMNAMNLKTMKLKDGSEIEVSNKFFASALAPKRAEAYQWLRDNGLGNIVKNEITVRFGKDEDTKATQYATLQEDKVMSRNKKFLFMPEPLELLWRISIHVVDRFLQSISVYLLDIELR